MRLSSPRDKYVLLLITSEFQGIHCIVSAFFERDRVNMDNSEMIKIYWRQYKLLEKKMIEISDYITITPKNYPVFSPQLLSMYLTICSEVDSVADELCSLLGITNGKEKFGINRKINIIVDKYKNLKKWRCVTKYPLNIVSLVPFEKFENDQPADWWQSYNKVKHFRSSKDENGVYNYERANLKNVLFSLSALYMILFKIKTEFYADANINICSEIFDIDQSNLK